jgi:UV DNA damage endonuclease
MVRKTFIEKGIVYASQVALQNIRDLVRVIQWNIQNNIFFYRMSSDMFPWMSEYELDDLPDINEISSLLDDAGRRAASAHMRLTFHPGPFNVLASPNPAVVEKTMKELRQHGEIMDRMNLPVSQFAKINIHVWGTYGDKTAALDRFAVNFGRLPASAHLRLTIENDDKSTMFSVADLLPLHSRTGVPIVFDYLHHQFCSGNLSEKEALTAAVSTWPKGITPVVHFSSAKRRFEDDSALAAAHADYIYESIPTYGFDLDIMLEAKAKELALQRYNEGALR